MARIAKHDKSLKKKLGEQVMSTWSHKTPGMLKFLIVSPLDNTEKVSVGEQKLFWSRNGMLL